MKVNQLSLSLVKKGDDRLLLLDEIDFELKPGETLALLGESGSGKSLTALSLLRLLPEQARFGRESQIIFEDMELIDLPERLMRSLRGKRLAMIFQEPMTALNPVLRIEQQLAEAISQHQHLNRGERRAHMIHLLHEVEIDDPELRLQQYPHQLSGGLKQRVVIAMALANQPDILIADEPTTALDVTIQAQILRLLKKLQQQHHMSLLLITHDIGVVRTMADRVCVVYAGKVVEEAASSDFFQVVRHPYTQQLLAALPTLSNRFKRLPTIPGGVPMMDALPSGCSFHPRCVYAFQRCSEEIPMLQRFSDRSIRCHLYPELSALPPLTVDTSAWENNQQAHQIILSAREVSVTFQQKTHWWQEKRLIHAVQDVSFDILTGQTLAVVGESGCGKTTLSRALLGLLAINEGEVTYRQQAVHRMSAKQLRQYRRRVQLIMQDPFSALNPRMTVGEIIAEGLVIEGLALPEIVKRQHELLEQVNLPRNSLNRYPHQFSGGQRQRINIARALATKPELIICDEPTSALDISVQAQILNLLKTLQQELQVAYLFITHNMAVVAYMANEVLVMRHGQVVEQGRAEIVLTAPKAAYTAQLLESAEIC